MDTNEIIDGLRATEDMPTFLLDHIATLDHLYKSVDEYTALLDALRETVGTFFKKICPLLSQDHPNILTKEWLNQNRNVWEVSGYSFFDNTTSGTTTEPFQYRIHNDVYYRIELFEHYIAILREFFIVPKRLLYFIDDCFEPNAPMITKVITNNAVMTHGLREAVEVLQVKKNTLYLDDHYQYFDELFAFLEDNPVELILADGNAISEMVAWLKKANYRKQICKLISTTSCGVVDEDLEYLRTQKLVDNWCDHMRCWDGGVTFFSCRYNVRHVVEHFSYPIAKDGKLVSQDFFSFPNPFWNYWNGDLVELGSKYQRCKCGRIYRDFGIAREREHKIHDTLTYEMDIVLNNINCLKRSVCFGNVLKVFTSCPLSTQERQRIRTEIPNMHCRFVVEQ